MAETEDLAEFLRACIAEDKAVARAEMPIGARRNGKATALRRLAECEAKRRIVALHSVNRNTWGDTCDGCQEECLYCMGEHTWPCPTLRLLTLSYADRPGYREEWKP